MPDDTQVPALGQGALADAFEESDLPYTVDLVDVRTASEGFVALIEREWTDLPR